MFGSEPAKRKYIIDELTQFAHNGNINKLVDNLNSVLKTPHQRLLLNEIKLFIPQNQQDLFDAINKSKIYESINDLPRSSSFIADLIAPNDQKDISNKLDATNRIPKGKRRVVLSRNKNDKFGLAVQGSKPVMIESVDANSHAQLSGLYANDVILTVNNMDVTEKNHKFLVELLKSSGLNPILEVSSKIILTASCLILKIIFLSRNR